MNFKSDKLNHSNSIEYNSYLLKLCGNTNPPAGIQEPGRQYSVPDAEQPKTSPEGIKQSAEYLLNAEFIN